MLKWLLPKEDRFFALFTEQAENVLTGARALLDLMRSFQDTEKKAGRIHEIEHQGDVLAQTILNSLDATFVTPIDREDIHAMARTLDDVMDEIDNAAHLIPLYKIEKIRGGARELTRVILEQCDEIRKAVDSLEQRKGVLERCIEINRLENEADRIHKTALGLLFDEERDPIMVMKWKEIFDVLEEATDCCEDVANLLENIVVKHS